MGSKALGAARLLAYLLVTLACVPFQLVALATGVGWWCRIPRLYHGLCLKALGMRIAVTGEPVGNGPVLFVSNHSSYLDVPVLGSLIEASFVAKAEVKDWPFFGFLAQLQKTVFIDRRGHRAPGQRDVLARRLERGDSLILFPEGTSSDGNRVLPFKSALFAAAIGDRAARIPDGLTVQPVAVVATRLDGLPMGRSFRPFYAWYGDMDLAPHLWQFAGLGRVTVEVRFGEPVCADQFVTRKALADHCWREVTGLVDAGLRARPARQLTRIVAARIDSAPARSDMLGQGAGLQ